jgi:NAD(P)-dependent dehydrogenase (short-subunit alcohol dehydrogenase family)
MPLNQPIRAWRDRRVWIVGASTGIGAALAERWGTAGARLALSARSGDKLAALAQGINAAGGAAMVLPLDVRSPDALQVAHAAIVERWGGIDLVVLNAGTYAPMRADAFDLGSMNEHFAVNYQGVVNALAAVIPGLLLRAAQQPAIAIVSSVAGYRGLPEALAYGPSKAALINLAETLYLDLSKKGIGVFLIDPGFVDTPLTSQNKFKMPALISAQEAARQIELGMALGEFEIHFPKRFTRVMRMLRLLPYGAYFRLVRRMTGL